MQITVKSQRRRSQRSPVDSLVVWIGLPDSAPALRWVSADIVDVIDGGCGLTLRSLVRVGSTVVVRGKLAANRMVNNLRAKVKWCAGRTDGTFRAGLEFLDGGFTPPHAEGARSGGPSGFIDLYEVMQLSPAADMETISRVYRLLALKYHPDNARTGNNEKFLTLGQAHRILSDPQQRASYDLRYREAKGLRRDASNVAAGLTDGETSASRSFRAVTTAYAEYSAAGLAGGGVNFLG